MTALQIAEGKLKAKDIVESVRSHTSHKESTVRNELAKLADKGDLVQPRYGYYMLPEQQEPEPDYELIEREVLGEEEKEPEREELKRLTDEELSRRGYRRIPDVSVGAGDEREPILEPTNGETIIPEWLARQEFGVSAERLVRARITGDSMKDTLWPGQWLWCALWDGEPLRDGSIYLIRGPLGAMVKRVKFDQKEEDGDVVPMLWIWSDNDDHPRFRLTREQFEMDYSVLAIALKKESYL